MKNQITLIQTTPGSWGHITILADGVQKYTACKTIGPGIWEIFDSDSTYVGTATSKPEIRAITRQLLAKI